MRASLYNHPRLVWLILLFIVVAGLNSYTNMPRLEDPHMASRIVQISTFYPGADAERVEAEITEKLETKIREIAEVKEVQSTSNPGVSFINVELEDRVTDAKPITARLRDKVAEVTDLPAGSTAPDFSDTRIYAHAGIIALTWEADAPINYAILGRHARELASRLRNLSGTDFVDIFGLPKEEIRVTFDDALLASHGVTVADMANAINQSDARGAAGRVSGGGNEFIVSVDGALDSLERIRKVSLSFDEAGASLRVGDVATVTRGFEDPVSQFAYLGGSYGVAVAARMFEDNRIDVWSEQVGRVMEDFSANLPASVKLERIFDQREYADARLNDLMGNLAVGALVVVVVLFISLGYRASFVAASILPLTLLAALAATDLLGLRIEQVLVTGLIVALGIMVDNAIVITDEIQQLRLKGVRRSVAVAKTIQKLWMPLAGSTATTIIAFMPLVLMPGNAGDFLIGIPAAVIASLIASYIIAFTIISAVAGRVVEGMSPKEAAAIAAQGSAERPKRVWWRDGIEGRWMADKFRASLAWSVRRPLRSMAVASAVPFLGFFLAGQLTEQFFPVSDRNQFRVELFLPSQASINETRRAVERLHTLLDAEEAIVSDHWFAGVRPAKFYYAMLGSNDGVSSIATAAVTTNHFDEIPDLIKRLQTGLEYEFPEAIILVREFITGPPIQAPLEVRVIGPDLAVLEELGDQVRAVMSREPHVTVTRTSLKAGRPQISVVAREDDVNVTELTLSQIEDQLRALTTGIIATQVIEETQQVPVRLVAERSERQDLASIANMNLRGSATTRLSDNSFEDIPLSALAEVKLDTKVGTITRFDSERVNTVQGYLEFGILPGDAFARFQQSLEASGLQVPPGYEIRFAGESAERDEAVGNLFGAVGMLVVMMLICIVVTFNSFRLAFVTLGAAAQAAGLGMFSLWLFNYPMSFVVIIGLMGLVGLAINAAIVILAELRGLEGARAGDEDAVVHGVMATGRHIISTTCTTVGGFMPLILAGGAFWPPFAVAIAGGAFLSMIVSFYFAPAAFLWLTRRNRISAPGGDQSDSDHSPAIVASSV